MVDNYTDETAYSVDNLKALCNANNLAPTISVDEAERIVEIAQQRADGRGESSGLDAAQTEVLIATEWTGFASNNFGFDNSSLNKFAIGVLEEEISMDKNATLFTDTVVIQSGWLESGDGRRSQIEAYEDTEYDNADVGDLWIADGAAEYIALFALDSELVHGKTTLVDAI